VADLARRAAMSRRTFVRRFEAALALPPRSWLTGERIRRSKMLLETTPMSLGDVAEQSGYRSLDTFRIAFRKLVGVAPATYRRRFA
jgi:AraC family transcriptional activator FtrA